MDAGQFDALARALTRTRVQRRSAATALLGLLALSGPLTSAGKSRSKKKLICHCAGKGESCTTISVTKAGRKKHVKNHPFDTIGPCPQAAAPSTCGDGIKNGDESDVDCGGPCAPCANGRACSGHGDCQSNHCVSSTCRECETAAHCPDSDNPCRDAACINGACTIVTADRVMGSCNTGMPGVCGSGELRCVAGEQQCTQTVFPTAEICDGLDNDCDGIVDEGAVCANEQSCQSGRCCKVDGFDTPSTCVLGSECCSDHCATHVFGTTCRPAGCLPTGANCSPNCASACCSFTASGTTCT